MLLGGSIMLAEMQILYLLQAELTGLKCKV